MLLPYIDMRRKSGDPYIVRFINTMSGR